VFGLFFESVFSVGYTLGYKAKESAQLLVGEKLGIRAEGFLSSGLRFATAIGFPGTQCPNYFA
jgi:hypothetical protein